MNESNETTTAQPEAESPAAPTTTFAEMGLRPELLRALADMGFTAPMAVQAATLPLVREGLDLMVQSRTGSGKTAGFGIPLLDKIVDPEARHVQAIILLPTRELALQVAAEIARIGAHSGIAVVPIYGGAPMGRQIEQLKAGGQIVCGTPGRVLDHIRRGTLKLDKVKCAVLDECDEMLSMGFQEDIENILEETPAERQTLLFSATVPEGIKRLARRFLRNPKELKLSADFVGVHEIRHVYYSIPGGQRENELLRVISFENPARAIVFCNTREETGRVADFLRRNGLEADAISSDLSQSDREAVMTRMRAGQIRFLVATDVAARGIDLENLPCVFNYTFPESPEVYIHRTGRTGRAGKHGTAISLIGPTEVGPFYYVKLLYKIKPEERSLPSEAEIRSKREGERIMALRELLPDEPSASWRSVARRLMFAVDGEQLIAAMVERLLGGGEATKSAAARAAATAAALPRRASSAEPAGGEREGRFDPRRERERERGRRSEGERGPRRDGRVERGDRPEREPRTARPSGEESTTPTAMTTGNGRAAGASPAHEGAVEAAGDQAAVREERVTTTERAFGAERAPRVERTSREERPTRAELGARDDRPAREARDSRPVRDARDDRPVRDARDDRPVREPGAERPVRDARDDRPVREPGAERSVREARDDRPVREPGVSRPAREPRDERPAREPGAESPARLTREERPVRFERTPREDRPRREERVPTRDERGDLRSQLSGAPAPTSASKAPGESEYSSVWGDEAPGRGRPEEVTEPSRSSFAESRPATARAPRPDAEPGDEARLFLNLGRKDGAEIEDVAALLARAGSSVPAEQIELMNTHSYVNVPAGDADRLCASISGQEHNGRQLICEAARPKRR